jgi:ribulose-5-phosphate 4-epimerase/fuculose-1-phosphate aldolase
MGVPTAVEHEERRRAWQPRAMPPVGQRLTAPQELACALRYLGRTGFSENIAGHITVRDEDTGRLWVNPWGLWWEEVGASDIIQVDTEGRVVAGRWDVTPAIHIHTELHRVRADANVVVHNHPYASTVLAAIGRLPEALHQTGSLFFEDLVWVDAYDGEIDTPDLGASLAQSIGPANGALLANHGVVVTGRTVAEAVYRAASLQRMCQLQLDVLQTGLPGRLVAGPVQKSMQRSLVGRAAEVFWAGALRQLLAADPTVLA